MSKGITANNPNLSNTAIIPNTYMQIGMKFIFHYQAKSGGDFSGRRWKYKLYFKKIYPACLDAQSAEIIDDKLEIA